MDITDLSPDAAEFFAILQDKERTMPPADYRRWLLGAIQHLRREPDAPDAVSGGA